MYNASQIISVAGQGGLTYAQNKNRGGRSSAKGRDFEIAYGAYRIALAAAQAVKDDDLGDGVSFHDQVLCFVDDFIMSRRSDRTLEQLKSGAASWNAGEHPLADDFRLQMKLDQAAGIKAVYRLVVSSDERRDALEASRPEDLHAVGVVAFPEGLSDLELIERLDDLSQALEQLSPRQPERIVREQVWRMLVGVWACSKGDQNLADLVNSAATGPGGIVAPMLPPYELSDDVKMALDNLPDFRFYIHRNFFGYDWRDGMQTGVSEYHCHTPEFEAFVRAVTDEPPADFFEFFRVFKVHV